MRAINHCCLSRCLISYSDGRYSVKNVKLGETPNRDREKERHLKSQSVALLDTIDLRRSCKYCSNTSSKVVSLPKQALTRPVLSVYCLLFNDLHNDELAQSTGRQQQFIPFQKSNARFQQPPKGCHFLDTIRDLTLTAVLTFRSD